MLSKYVWDNITQENYWCNVGPDHIVIISQENSYIPTKLPWFALANIAQETYLCNAGPQSTNNFAQKNNLQFCLDLSWPTLHKRNYLWNVGPWLRYNFYVEDNLCNVVSTMLVLSTCNFIRKETLKQVLWLTASDIFLKKEVCFNINQRIWTTLHRLVLYPMLV